MKLWTSLAAVVFSFSLISSVSAEEKPAAPAAAAPAASSPAGDAGQAAPEGSVEVLRMVVTTAVENREPAQEITSASVGDTVFVWTQIRSGLGETAVTHRWLHEADNAGDVALTVRSSPWRTWSRKTVTETGNWKVQVLDAQGGVLKEAAFTVTAAATAAPAASSAQ
jgi:hypothetical protein